MAYLPDQETRKARTTVCHPAYLTSCDVVVEIELPGTVRIAGHAQVVRVANICAELERMIPPNLRPVVHELVLMLALRERAVTLIHSQRVSEIEIILETG